MKHFVHSKRPLQSSPVRRSHAGRTYMRLNMVHVGAVLQQQPHNVRVAVVGCIHQRRFSVLPHNTRGVQRVRTTSYMYSA